MQKFVSRCLPLQIYFDCDKQVCMLLLKHFDHFEHNEHYYISKVIKRGNVCTDK